MSTTRGRTTTRTAVVTGGGRGIGLAVAQGLPRDGWSVLLTSRGAEAGRAAAQLVGHGPGRACSTCARARRLVRAVPRHRGALMRGGAIVPAAGLIAFEAFHRCGLRRQGR